MLKEFREFISRGNVVDLAVAVVIGAAFGKIIASFVEGVLMPPIGLLLRGVDFSSLFVVLDSAKGIPASLADAKAKGIPVLAYGAFLNEVINFLIIALVLFLVVRAMNRMKRRAEPASEPATRECPFCCSTIPVKATRCAHCIADLKAQ